MLVPIIVLRDHALYNPFVQGPEAIDLQRMETEVRCSISEHIRRTFYELQDASVVP